MKTYVITVSKTFLKGHPKTGQPTNFKQSILEGSKIHTIRGNARYWRNIINEVQSGKAVLSVREWSGKPYRSKQVEIMQLDANSGIGYQKVFLSYPLQLEASIDCNYFYKTEILVKNDGLDFQDFEDWFFPNPTVQDDFSGIIIHFTDFRY